MEISNSEFKDRAVAAIAALGVGDAAGDLGRDAAVRQKLGIVTKLLPEGKSTDDTEFTVLTARGLIDNYKNYTAKSVADTWRSLVLADGGAQERGGIPLYGALWNLTQGLEPPVSGKNNTLNIDDGAAMRAVPFAVYAYGDPELAAKYAAIDASVSHYRDGIWAAQAIAAAATVALTGGSVETIIDTGRKFIPEGSWLGSRMEAAMNILDEHDDIFDQYEALHSKLWAPVHSVSPEAIPQVFALFKMSRGDFKKAFLLSANFGRDADTICALVLSLCAAREGTKVIPREWIEQVRKPAGVCLKFAAKEDLVHLAEQLADIAIENGGV